MGKEKSLKETPVQGKFRKALAEKDRFKTALGIRFREVMVDRDVTISEISKTLHYTESRIKRWLTPKGRYAPLEFYLYFCFVYDVSPTFLFWGIGEWQMSDLANLEQINIKLDVLLQNGSGELDRMPDPTFISRIDNFQFVHVNQRAIENYGYCRREFLQMQIFDIEQVPSLRKTVRQLYDVTPVGHVVEVDGINKTKDGRCFPVNVRFNKLDEKFAVASVRELKKNDP